MGVKFLVFLLLIIIIILIIVFSDLKTENNPCINYSGTDLASSVSLTCFRYIWKKNLCKDNIPDNYKGWWLRSPDGGRTVNCIYPKLNDQCGAGNYLTIIIYSRNCIINYNGI